MCHGMNQLHEYFIGSYGALTIRKCLDELNPQRKKRSKDRGMTGFLDWGNDR